MMFTLNFRNKVAVANCCIDVTINMHRYFKLYLAGVRWRKFNKGLSGSLRARRRNKKTPVIYLPCKWTYFPHAQTLLMLWLDVSTGLLFRTAIDKMKLKGLNVGQTSVKDSTPLIKRRQTLCPYINANFKFVFWRSRR